MWQAVWRHRNREVGRGGVPSRPRHKAYCVRGSLDLTSGQGAALEAGELRARLETGHFGVEDDPACRAKALARGRQFDARGVASLIGDASETRGFFRGDRKTAL